MADITIIKPHDEGRSALEVTVNDEKFVITRGEKTSVPAYVAAEVRRSIALRDDMGLSDIDEREDTGGGGGGSNVETATIEIAVADGTPAITSGEFPEWCTAENSDYIYGKIGIKDVYIGDNTIEDALSILIGIVAVDGLEIFTSATQTGYGVLQFPKELSSILLDAPAPNTSGQITRGTLTITLIYMPEE